jgi:hypothetical protein
MVRLPVLCGRAQDLDLKHDSPLLLNLRRRGLPNFESVVLAVTSGRCRGTMPNTWRRGGRIRNPWRLSLHVSKCHEGCTQACMRSCRRPRFALARFSDGRAQYCVKYCSSATCACLQNKPLFAGCAGHQKIVSPADIYSFSQQTCFVTDAWC